HPAWGNKKITRVILDSNLRFPLAARILKTLPRGRIIVFAREGAAAGKAEALRKKGVEVALIDRPLENGGLEAVLAELGRREIAGVLVEGGGRLETNFIERRLADKIVLTLSPNLIGGRNAPGFFGGEGAGKVRLALRLKSLEAFGLGNDLILEGYF
ncbi:MAG: RibD family protein, partial [Candidatus Aminicenantales bacterium]